MIEARADDCGPHCGTQDGETAHCPGCHSVPLRDHGNARALGAAGRFFGWEPVRTYGGGHGR